MRVSTVIVGIIVTVVMISPGSIGAILGTPETPAAGPVLFVYLDAPRIATHAEAGWPFVLPTMWGDVTVHATSRVRDQSQVIRLGEDGRVVDQAVHVPSVWNVASDDDSVTGILLADGVQVRAALWTAAGRSSLEPGIRGLPTGGVETLHRMYSSEPTPMGLDVQWEGAPIKTPGEAPELQMLATYTKTQTVYVDNEFVANWGTSGSWTWANQVNYLTAYLNSYTNDFQLVYDDDLLVWAEPGTSTNDPWTDGFHWLRDDLDNIGRDTRVFWSHVDYDGWIVGQAGQPADYAMLQTTDDGGHFGTIVDSDFERAFLMAHELGHNNNGDHLYGWGSYESVTHFHRSILYEGGWDHYHECWSSTNGGRMATHLGNTFVGTACS